MTLIAKKAAFALLLFACAGLAQAAEPVARVRVAFDRHGITDSHAEGLADIASGRAISADDPARIASVSKLAAAIGVMRLVEQGKLKLDQDVSQQLGWALRNPAHPEVPITLRMLLSHTSSLTDNAGYWNVPLDGDIRSILGKEAAWDTTHAPGRFFRYSNLNFPLIAQVMERASGERFDRLMRRLVFEPLKIDACHNWSGCSDEAIARAVVLYDTERKPQVDNLQGRRPECPVMRSADGGCDIDAHWRPGSNGAMFGPQGSMRISANGLARIGRMLLNNGRLDGVRVLKRRSVRQLLTPMWVYDGHNGVIGEEDEPDRGGFFCAYGLATQHIARGDGRECRDDLFGDARPRVGHSGNAYGLLSGLWIDPRAGTGVAYFATGVPNDSTGQHSAFSHIEEQGASGW
ncbi:serine hydrolase domain-containing protein [Luteimonas sp. e5]